MTYFLKHEMRSMLSLKGHPVYYDALTRLKHKDKWTWQTENLGRFSQSLMAELSDNFKTICDLGNGRIF